MKRFFSTTVRMGVGILLLLGGVSARNLPARDTAETNCNTSYPEGFFRACYFQGQDPYNGSFLGSQEEAPLGRPVAARAFGIDHDWGIGPVFSGITPGAGGAQNDISAFWRGRLYFNGGRYQFTTFARDGVRLFIDEELLIDQWIPDDYWYRFGTVIELPEGFHNIRVEWFASGQTPGSTLLRLHWDRVPASPQPHQVMPMVIDVYLLKQQDVCIAGNPYVSGEHVDIYNADGSVYRSWQVEGMDPNKLPKTLPPSDPSLDDYAQVECFSFGYRPEEIPILRAEVDQFADLIRNWSGGDIQPEIHLRELQGEANLGLIGTTWLIAPRDIAPLAESSMTTDSDFAIVLSSNDDPATGHYYVPFACGATYGVEQVGVKPLGGTGYSWVTCVDSLTILHEWEHQFTAAVRSLLQFESIYMNDGGSPERAYPPCGTGDPDIFKWFPDSEDWGRDPDSPWCGMMGSPRVGIAEQHLFAHYDASLFHYPLGFFTGNHCNDRIQDLGETGVDTGANCPSITPPARIEMQPADDTWIQVRSAGTHGLDSQLQIQRRAKVTYIKFDLKEVPGEITSATVTATIAQAKAETVGIYAVHGNDWQEETLRGKHAPRLEDLIDAAAIPRGRNQTISWDVSEYVRSAMASGAHEVSFALVLTDGSKASFFSKESSHAPLLTILSQ